MSPRQTGEGPESEQGAMPATPHAGGVAWTEMKVQSPYNQHGGEAPEGEEGSPKPLPQEAKGATSGQDRRCQQKKAKTRQQ